MNQKARVLTGVFMLLGIMGAFASEATAQRIRLEGRLFAAGHEVLASGKAQFEQRGTQFRFSTEAEDLLVTKEIFVFVEGILMGSAPVNSLGIVDLNISGSTKSIRPLMQPGDLVEVFDQDGALILDGILSSKLRGRGEGG
jgi:hypothetical protein